MLKTGRDYHDLGGSYLEQSTGTKARDQGIGSVEKVNSPYD